MMFILTNFQIYRNKSSEKTSKIFRTRTSTICASPQTTNRPNFSSECHCQPSQIMLFIWLPRDRTLPLYVELFSGCYLSAPQTIFLRRIFQPDHAVCSFGGFVHAAVAEHEKITEDNVFFPLLHVPLNAHHTYIIIHGAINSLPATMIHKMSIFLWCASLSKLYH